MRKSLLLTLAMLTTATAVFGSTIVSVMKNSRTQHMAIDPTSIDDAGIIVKCGTAETDRTKAPNREEASAVASLTVNFQYATPYALGNVYAYSEDGSFMLSPTGKTSTFELDPDTYTIVTTFYEYKKGYTGRYNNLCGLYHVVKENVVVEEGASPEITVDVAEASNTYNIKNLLPSGVEATLGTVTYTSKKEYEVISEGSALYIGIYPSIYHKKHGQILWTSIASQWNIQENDFKNSSDISDFLKIHVNNLSDDCIIGAQCVINTGTRENHDDFLIEHFEYPSVIAQKNEFVNNVNDYREITQEFTQSMIGQNSQYQPTSSPLALTIEKYWNGHYVGGMGSTMGKVNLCMPTPGTHIPDFLEVLEYSYTDMVYDVVISGNMRWEYGYPISAQPMVIRNDGSISQMAKTHEILYNLQQPEDIDQWTHPLLRNDIEDIVIPIGSSPNYVTLLNTITDDESYGMTMLRATPEHKGYTQESHWTLYYTNIFSGKYNGEDVPIGPNIWDPSVLNTIEEWLAYDWSSENKLSGKTELDYKTAPNQINGVDYSTTCHVEFNTSSEDYVLPLVQYMQLKDADGKVTYSLPTASGSVLNIVAGDFMKTADGQFKPSDKVVKPTLKYSVSGTDDFKELELTPWSGDENLPYFAPAYTADLAQITEISPAGWFDLTIDMQDESGNHMTQTIAPAFQILSNSGISSTIADNSVAVKVSGRDIEVLGADNAVITVYSIDGTKVANVNGTSASLREMSTGIYIVEVIADGTRRTVKVAVR